MSPKTAQTEEYKDVSQLRAAIEEINSVRGTVGTESNLKLLDSQKAKLQRQLVAKNKAARDELQGIIENENADSGLKFRIVTRDDFESALQGRVTDERASALMEGAESLGVTLEPGEIVTIKKGSGVDTAMSETLTDKFTQELDKLGPGFVVMATRGNIGTGGPRGDLSAYPVGTELAREYNGEEYRAEVRERDGKRFIIGLNGPKFKGKEFDSLSGAGSFITNYSVRGPQWWKATPPSTN